MPLTFVDGSTAEVVFPESLGLQGMRVQAFTAGGLEGVDRTINFPVRRRVGLPLLRPDRDLPES